MDPVSIQLAIITQLLGPDFIFDVDYYPQAGRPCAGIRIYKSIFICLDQYPITIFIPLIIYLNIILGMLATADKRNVQVHD